jgi:hypothetical protein
MIDKLALSVAVKAIDQNWLAWSGVGVQANFPV